MENAGFNFRLRAEGHPEIIITESNYKGSSSMGDGDFQAFYVGLDEYQLNPSVEKRMSGTSAISRDFARNWKWIFLPVPSKTFRKIKYAQLNSDVFKRWMGIADDNPVLFPIRHQPGSMYILAIDSLSLTNPMELAIGATVPYHISGVDRVDQDGPDSGIGPLAAVDVRPHGA